jgi:TolB-like protein
VVSFRIDLAPIPAALEYFLNTSQWLDASATGVERALPKLVDAVQRGVAHVTGPASGHSGGAARPAARTESDSSLATKTRQRSRRMLVALAAITAFALACLAADKFWLSKRSMNDQPSVAETFTSPANPSMGLAIPANSIAVLPFVDMSAEKNQEYMADGMAEELLNLLAQVPDLKVIARTSSFAFKDQDIDIAEIARKLNVAHVLEGSVRTSGNKLRITAQLVRTADSTHLWSERYDRPMDDILAVQDEIANAIVQALQIQLSGGELNRRKGGTQNLEAYRLYLRAMSTYYDNTRSSLDASGEYLEQALKLDANFGKAWSLLAETVLLKTDSGWLEPRVGYELARQRAQRAIEVSPEMAHPHAMLQYVYRTLDWDWAKAEREGQLALAIDPEDPTALSYSASLYRTLGRWDEAERRGRAALIRDPINTYVIWDLATNYYSAGRFAEAEAMYRQLLELSPNFYWTRPYLGKTLLAQGKAEAALAIVQEESDEPARLKYLPAVLLAAGRRADADEALRAQIAYWASTGAYWVAQNYAYRGDHELALEWLERAYEQKDPVLVEIVGEHLFKGLYDDPRYRDFLRKMNLSEPGNAG